MIELALLILIAIALVIGGLAWLTARVRPGWSRLLIVPLVALPLPLLILAGSMGGMIYGWELPGETCGLNRCGGYMILGVLGIALSLGAVVIAIPAALVGAILARRNMPAYEAKPEEYFK